MTIVARVTTWLRETTHHYRLLCLGLDGDVMNVNMQLTDQRSEAGLLSSDEY